ncbi:hypothetical protein D9M72_413290 [compost metagenome]
MDVANAAGAGETADVLIDIATRHLLQRAEAELQAVRWRVDDGHQPVVFFWPIDEPRSPAQLLRRRIIRMGAEHHTRLLGDRDDFLQEMGKPIPELRRTDGDRSGTRDTTAVAHVPDHAVGNRRIRAWRDTVFDPEADGLGATTGIGAACPAIDAGEREVIADAGDAGATGIADQLFQPLDLPGALRSIEKHVGPKARREILDRRDLQAAGAHVLHQCRQLLVSPEPVAGTIAPAALVTAVNLRILAGEIVGQMRDHMGRTCLLRKLKIVRGELFPVKPEADLHLINSCLIT